MRLGVVLIMLQLRIVIRQTLQSGHWPHHRKVIPAGTTHPYARLVAAHIHFGGPGRSWVGKHHNGSCGKGDANHLAQAPQ